MDEVAKCGGDVGFGLFDFDVHSCVGQGVKDFGEGGDGDVFVAIGIGFSFIVCPSIPCVEGFEFFECEVAHQTFAICGAINGTIVEDDQDAVFGAVYVHFENIDAKFDGLFESVEGIFGPQSPSTSVGYDFDAICTLAKKRMALGGFGQISCHKVDGGQYKDEPKRNFTQLLEHEFSEKRSVSGFRWLYLGNIWKFQNKVFVDYFACRIAFVVQDNEF